MSSHPLEHLSQIETNWTQLGLVQGEASDLAAVEDARRQLLHRYAASVYQYLFACVNDEQTASELAQDFAVRFLAGRYESADRDRGRFRDFLKRCLSNMVTDYFRRLASERKKLQNLKSQIEKQPLQEQFDSLWQQEILSQTWTAFENHCSPDSSLYLILKRRAEFPDESAAEIAAATEAAAPHLRPLTNASVRQILHRARRMFADLLRKEVAQTIADPSPQNIDEELAALGLLKYCES